MLNRDDALLKKIIEYCGRIESNLERINGNKEVFLEEHLFQDACCMCIVQIGEMVALLSEETRKQDVSIPWRAIKDTRNFYVHDYGSIDLELVWNTINSDIPLLMLACQNILNKENNA